MPPRSAPPRSAPPLSAPPPPQPASSASTQWRALKSAVYEQIARVGKAMAAPARIEILDLLNQHPRTVEALARLTGLTVANTSQHLQVLRAAGLVEARREGTFVEYRPAAPHVTALTVTLQDVARARLAEIDRIHRQFLEGRDLEPVDQQQLLSKVRGGEVTVLDVRPADEYAAGHLPGAVSVPLAQLEEHLRTLPADRQVVAYCRGPWCVLAVEAVERLRQAGFHADRLELGVAEWQARGWGLAQQPPTAEAAGGTP